VTVADGTVYQYDYDANHLVKVTYPDQHFHRYLYENSQNLQVITGVVDGKGKRFVAKGEPSRKSQTYYVPTLPFAVGSPENIAVRLEK
jgi:hypothetical protein